MFQVTGSLTAFSRFANIISVQKEIIEVKKNKLISSYQMSPMAEMGQFVDTIYRMDSDLA